MTALLEIGAGVGWPDGEAAGAARSGADARTGRLGELIEWFAGTRGSYPPAAPQRTRCVVLGPVAAGAADIAASLDVGVRGVDLPAGSTAGFALGAEVADAEIEAGTDLIVVTGRDETPAPTVLISLLTGAEPVALMPRGAAAVDSEGWMARAAQVRDARRRVAPLRARPDELLAALDSPVLAAAAGLAMRAAARRTPVVLDGIAVLAGALLCVDSQPRARRWWQIADTSPERAHARAVEQLALPPLLDLGTRLDDGTAGLLAVAMLRAAVLVGARDE